MKARPTLPLLTNSHITECTTSYRAFWPCYIPFTVYGILGGLKGDVLVNLHVIDVISLSRNLLLAIYYVRCIDPMLPTGAKPPC